MDTYILRETLRIINQNLSSVLLSQTARAERAKNC